MRILQVSSARNFGGGETHVIELTEGLRQLGHEVVVAGRGDGPLHPDIALPFRNSADFLSALRLRKILKAERFDVVHAHVARDYTVVAAAAWGVPDVKVVFTRHLLYPVTKHVLYRRVDGWLAPTSQILKTLGHLKPKHSAIIPNWVDLQKFSYRPRPLHDPVNVGLLGQISPHKGHDDAVEAMRILGPGFRLSIAGKGELSYLDALKQKASGLPVDFLGFASLPDFFAMIDVLAVPSWEEPFGIVVLEAMASGIPVVSTACGGPLDIITSGIDGLLVSPRNPAELAAALRSLGQSEPLRKDIVQHARSRVEQEYDIAKVIPRAQEFYRRLLGEGSPFSV
jgi:glycosyltransferase involved in cell wall biosynthesis